jgi:ribosomal protein L37AE/L43A
MAYSIEGEQRNTGRTHFPKGIIPWNKGKKMSDEYRKRCSEDMMGRPSPRKGVKLSDETKEKIKIARVKQGKVWDNKGIPWSDSRYGASFESILITTMKSILNENKNEYTCDWKEIRKVVYIRDKWTCQECYRRITRKTGIACHHIDYIKINNDLMNLITLCTSCHGKTTRKTDKWIEYYQDKMIFRNKKPTT